MKHVKLGDLNVSRIGLGAMGMSAAYTGAGTDDAGSIRAIRRALELGVTFLDTAETYGPFVNEELVGRAVKGHRDEVVLATKFGRISHARGGARILDSSPANIRTAIEGSLRRLGTAASRTGDVKTPQSKHSPSAPSPPSRPTENARPPNGWPPVPPGRTATSCSATRTAACARPHPPQHPRPCPAHRVRRAYQAQLAGHTIGETFGRAAEFLKLAAANATSIANPGVHAG